MPADCTTSPTNAHPAMQGGQSQPMPADSTTPSQRGTSATGGMSPGPSPTRTQSTSTSVTTTRVVPADDSSVITERPARSDRN